MSTKEYYNSRKQDFIKDLIELINRHISQSTNPSKSQ